MTGSQFEELLAEAIKEHGGEYVDVPEEMEKPHRFTRSFEKRMQKLIWKERGIRPPRKRLSLRMLIVVIVTAVIAVSSVMTVSAFREAIIGFITEVYEKFTNVQAQPDEDAPDTLEEIYEVTWVPEGFELVDEKRSDISYRMQFRNNENFIFFKQTTVMDYVTNYDTETTGATPFCQDGIEGFWIIDGDTNILVWKSHDYVFEITVYIKRSEENIEKILTDLYKSVKKAEK